MDTYNHYISHTNSNRNICMLIFNLFLVMVSVCCIFGILYFLFVKDKIWSSDTYDNYYDPKLDELKQRLMTVFPDIGGIKISGSSKSFTINKKHIHICTRDENDEYYDDNMLIYVLLHEYAHVKCPEIGHTEKYKQIFREILQKAAKAGIYNPNKPPIDDYCNY